MLLPRVLLVGTVVFGSWGLAGCGASSPPSANQQAFLGAVHQAAPDIGNYRSDGRVTALGEAVCNDLAANVSISDIATRLSSSSLPTPDLGAVMTSASEVLCPKYASAFAGGA